jgi:hypothetical protein
MIKSFLLGAIHIPSFKNSIHEGWGKETKTKGSRNGNGNVRVLLLVTFDSILCYT